MFCWFFCVKYLMIRSVLFSTVSLIQDEADLTLWDFTNDMLVLLVNKSLKDCRGCCFKTWRKICEVGHCLLYIIICTLKKKKKKSVFKTYRKKSNLCVSYVFGQFVYCSFIFQKRKKQTIMNVVLCCYIYQNRKKIVFVCVKNQDDR